MKNPHVAFFTLIALACLSTSGNAQSWVRRPGTEHWYVLTNSTGTWQSQQSLAESWGANLACMEDPAENQFAAQFLSASGSSESGAWFGLYQDTQSASFSEPAGGWAWVNSAPLNFTSWSSGQPDDAAPTGSAGENHGYLYDSGQWNDLTASTPRLALVELISSDCDGNGVPDSFELLMGSASDSNNNDVIDSCEEVLPGLNEWTRRAGTDSWYIQTSDYSWEMGRTLARNAGADLAVIEDEEELDWCMSYAGGSYHHIGLYQDHSAFDFVEPGGGWVWVEPSVTYSSWAEHQPNNHPSGTEHHGAITDQGIFDVNGAVPRSCIIEVHSIDCDNNGIPDTYELALNPTLDSDGDGFLDACGTPVFGNQQVITEGADEAESVYACDLDADGDLDVLSASRADNKVAWYENQGDGTFTQEQIISTDAEYVVYVRAADLDGDGHPDVISASYNGDRIGWHRNDGAGNFAPEQLVTSAVNGPHCFDTADLDGDGDLDVVSASTQDDKFAWFENLGDGTFGPEHLLLSGSEANTATAVFAADLDGDLDIDVLAGARDVDEVYWFENQCNGGFSGKKHIGDQTGPLSVFAADLDNDGDLDALAASVYDSTLAWYLNNGDGTFGPLQTISVSSGDPVSIFSMDVDQDGHMDVLSASESSDEIAWHQNLGDGSAFLQRIVSTDALRAQEVYAADLDGDGDTDLLSASQLDDKIAWYENLLGLIDCNGNGLSDLDDIANGVSLDCDGDGIPDECGVFVDCNFNGLSDSCDIADGFELDCNGNGIPDECDVYGFTSLDCNSNLVPDECEQDCDRNCIPDDCDPSIPDCDSDGIPDGCETDCNLNSTPDDCELVGNDCNASGIPDDCELADNDCNSNLIPDECDTDCNADGTPDDCQTLADCNSDGVPDECQPFGDCNSDGTPDECQLENNDCNSDLIPDD